MERFIIFINKNYTIKCDVFIFMGNKFNVFRKGKISTAKLFFDYRITIPINNPI